MNSDVRNEEEELQERLWSQIILFYKGKYHKQGGFVNTCHI